MDAPEAAAHPRKRQQQGGACCASPRGREPKPRRLDDIGAAAGGAPLGRVDAAAHVASSDDEDGYHTADEDFPEGESAPAR